MGNQSSQPISRDLDYWKLINVLPPEIREWSSTFKAIYPNGKISLKKFTDFFTLLFPFGNPEPFCRRLFYNVNIQQQKEVELEELLIAFTILLKGSAFERLRWLYRFYDEDKDGLISRKELGDTFRAINMLVSNSMMSEIQVNVLVEEIFSSACNKSGFLTFNEFETLSECNSENFRKISSFLDW